MVYFNTAWTKTIFPFEDSLEGATLQFRTDKPSSEEISIWTEIAFIAKDRLYGLSFEIDDDLVDYISEEYER